MKRVIRNNIWESNSSSTHSVSVSKYSNKYWKISPAPDGYVHCSFGEFGWEVEDYCDPGMKLSYALTMVAETECFKTHWNGATVDGFKTEEEFYETDGFKLINECVKNVCNCDGVIVDNPGIKFREYETNSGKMSGYVEHYGYIDHQSYENYNNLQEFLDDYGVDIEHFIFDKSVVLHTDNDNH